jgi:MerR family transcriptional regulator, light-induced transcriptional regulator
VAVEGLSAGAAARSLGVAVTTLRTWHQRYGLGPSHHVPGQHRRYTPEDMERLQVMRRLTAQGVPPAEAAAWARRVPMTSAPTADIVWPQMDVQMLHGRHGGGQTIPLGRAAPAARGLARAAMRLDAPAQRDILEMTVANLGVVEAWEQVIMPVLMGIGERYESTRRFIEVEHLTSRCVTEVLSSVPRPPSEQVPRVLLAAADEEQHTLPLEALAAALAQAGVATRLLGARVPPEALSEAVTRTGPAAVVLWSQTPATGDPAQLAGLQTSPHPPLLVAAAGPGWSADDLPTGVPLLPNLSEAVRIISAAAADARQAS